jgi:17beta-estradiol 17-dehydrogenase / very-long-chain 3-oxoacyl-CoA reductase
MDYLSHYLSKEGLEESQFRKYLLLTSLALGLIQVTSWALRLVSFVYRHTIKRPLNFTRAYNQGGSWAVVTGGSDGIGEQFCRDLANQGFNICIIARNEAKMQEKLASIKAEALKNGKNIETRYVVADLADLTRYRDYQVIADQLRDIDIGLLILNAGWTLMGPFKDLTPQEIEQTVTINALHPIYLLKALLNQLLARKKRSGIVITSSGLGSVPVPGVISYSAAKAFSSYLGQALNIELRSKIDVISFECGEVSTKLLGNRKGFGVITPPKATWGCLRDLGTYRVTNGAFRHEFLMSIMPSFIM